MKPSETYEVFAVRYATHAKRQRHHNFIIADPHDGPMPIDFFVWALVNDRRTIIVDTGFDREEAERRGREVLRTPSEGLALIGVDSNAVEDVIITHMHYDHGGTVHDFASAKFHLQDEEMAYITGRHMGREPFRHPYSVHHVTNMVEQVFAGRVAFHDGEDEIAPGVTIHHIGGHTKGLQCVRVYTKRGWVVLASDASHLYENMQRDAPFPIVYNVGDMLQGYDTMRRLAESESHIVPGHDPLVMNYYPAPSTDLQGTVVRLDVEPTM